MRIAILFAFIIPFSFLMAGQPQRYLISSKGDIVPLANGESATKVIQSFDCSQPRVFGIVPDPIHGGNMGTLALYPGEAAGMPFIAPFDARIDTFYLFTGSIDSASDSTLVLRWSESFITPTHGPGDGTYPEPCTPWGYWKNTLDPYGNGIAAFREDATDTTWYSTVGGPVPSFPPFGRSGNDGLGGVPFNHLIPNAINKYPLIDVTDINVRKGDAFFFSVKPGSVPALPTDRVLSLRVLSYPPSPTPSKLWKFYRNGHPSSGDRCSSDTIKGWYNRGGDTGNGDWMAWVWWFSVTYTGNPAPDINFARLFTTLSTAPQRLDVYLTDCNAGHPESTGVASAEILYSVDDGPTLSVPLSFQSGDTWSGFIPGAPAGSIVSYRVSATDIQGMSDTSGLLSYRVVNIHSDGYRCDTGYACTSTPIHSTGTAIDTSEWFISARDYEKAPPGFPPHRGDDGTAGPYSLGGPFVFYGDTVNYAWIGVNGAIALSKTATDTIDVNLKGFATSGWDFPYRQHHSRADTNSEGGVPKNFIAPFWSDWIVKQDSPIGTFGKIRHYADSSRFITEWDSIGVFDANGAAVDIGVFRVVLHRASGIIEFQNDDIAIFGTETAPGTLIGMQCDSLTHHVAPGDFPPFNFWNSSGYPLETRLHNGLCFRYVPVYSTLAAGDGWQLVSVSTSSPDMTKSFLFPNACSNAFFYDGTYQPHYSSDALRQGVGYWMKFCGPIPLIGTPAEEETVHVNVGWNMIGSIGSPLAATSIVSSPPSIITGNFFGFEGNYTVASTLEPGRGYWVNASADGTLYLTGSANASSNARIRIVPTNELPPPPPSESDLTHPVSHLPHQFALGQNYPNPFNPTTVIRFEIRDPGFVLLKIFDVLGREVATIVNERLEPGEYARTWDASNIPSGVYFYRLTAGTFSQTREMTLLR